MKKSDRRIAGYLDYLLEAIARIEHYTQDVTDDTFRVDSLVQDAALRNLTVIGVAAHDLSRDHPDFVAAHADVPWKDLSRNRNLPGSFHVDTDAVWQTIVRDLPVLKLQIEEIRREAP